MAVYSVMEPPADPARDVRGETMRGDGAVFLRDGFSFGAFLFGPFWMIRHRLWLVLLCWLLVMSGLEVIFRTFAVSPNARGLAIGLVAFLVALEAATLRRWTLVRAGYLDRGIVVADDLEAAEQRFFAGWTPERGPQPDQAAATSAPPSTTPLPVLGSGRTPGVIGLFPRAGGAP